MLQINTVKNMYTDFLPKHLSLQLSKILHLRKGKQLEINLPAIFFASNYLTN